MFGKKKTQKRDLGFNTENENQIVENKKEKKLSPAKEKKQKVKKAIIPRTVQESIPYKAIYPNGIIEVENGIFSKAYLIEDVNFSIASDDEQENIFNKYVDFLNSFDSEVHMQLVIYNRNIDQKEVNNKILLKMQNDELNEFREEYNQMLLDKLKEGKNNIQKEKYIVITIKATDLDTAFAKFSKIDSEVSASIKRINSVETVQCTAIERLEMLADIYSETSDNSEFYQKLNLIENDELKEINPSKKKKEFIETFSFEKMFKHGLTTKDLIGPSMLKFSGNYIQIGEKFAKVLFIDTLPSFINSNVLSDITELDSNMLMSIHFNKLRADKATKLLKNQMININSNVVDAQKRAVKGGYSAELISPELLKAQQEASELLDDLTTRNQSLILTTFVIALIGESLESVDKAMEQLKTIMGKHLCQIKVLSLQQEAGFNSALPLGRCDVYVDRLLTTDSAAIFIPFSTQELTQKSGMYYGLNAVSKNLILFNRKNSKNANGVILGTPGSGKSFTAKREMINVILNTNDDIYIVDPEREYLPLAKLLGGEVIKIAAGGTSYLNPMDMDINYGNDDDNKTDPIAMKCDFIGGLCETMSGDKRALSATQKSIVDRCVRILYQDYIAHMKEVQRVNPSISCDMAYSPTLKDFYELLLTQPEYESQSLALSLERFCVGSLDTFAHHTNVKKNNRFVVYDIKDIGDGMKELGLQVCLNSIWNQIIENKRYGKYTWFYLDEFYLLTQTYSSAVYLKQVYKRARKWFGIPTGITQNVGDLLESAEACAILNNCDFILMLNQSPIDKQKLAAMLNISATQLSYITNSDPGQGLIYTGKSIVPFVDKFPMNTKLYKVMTTKPEDIID